MKTHRWWLALIAALLTPWIGPHIDRYMPVGWLLMKVGTESADTAFWIIAGILLALGYGVWVLLLSGIAALLSRRPRGREG